MMEKATFPRILSQALAWAIVWLLVYFVLANGFEAPARFLARILPALVGIIIIVLVNNSLLLPRLYFGNRVAYIVAGFVLVVGLSLLLHYGWPLLSGKPTRGMNSWRKGGVATLYYMLPLGLAFMGSAMVEVMRFANQQQRQVLRTQGEKLATELKLLKSQINPHFLFNSLNNIYTLTLLQDPKAPESLLKLSNMLRYMLYEAETDTVPLAREIAYLHNYINLMQLKNSRGLNIHVSLDDSQPNLLVAPLLFITFVENAFKHGRIEDLEHGFINIELLTEPDGTISFTVINNLPATAVTKDGVGGIGLDNLRKRLTLQYPGRHVLTTTTEGDVFRAHFQIQTK